MRFYPMTDLSDEDNREAFVNFIDSLDEDDVRSGTPIVSNLFLAGQYLTDRRQLVSSVYGWNPAPLGLDLQNNPKPAYIVFLSDGNPSRKYFWENRTNSGIPGLGGNSCAHAAGLGNDKEAKCGQEVSQFFHDNFGIKTFTIGLGTSSSTNDYLASLSTNGQTNTANNVNQLLRAYQSIIETITTETTS
jgi:hypothetical protein